jgi:hypothetical protein
MPPEVMEQIRQRAAADSPLLEAALRSGDVPGPRYAGRCPDRYLIGVEMIREGYLLHNGRSVLFSQDDPDLALLTGDYLYAAGLVEICATGDLRAVRTLARLIAECSARRGDAETAGDEPLWDEAIAGLGG